jgi:hypothetical protein
MPSLRLLCPLVALAAAGCVQKPVATRPAAIVSSPAFDDVVQKVAAQVKRCYRTPRVASSGKQISTRLLVRYRADGGLAALPVVISQAGVTPDNSAYAGKMAEAAGLAVVRCAPVRLPPDL